MLQRLRIAQKFILMGAIFALPLLYVTFQMVASMRELGSAFAQKELQGLAYQKPVVKLIHALQIHRGVAATVLEGETGLESQLKTAADQVGTAITEIDAVDESYGAKLGVVGSWKPLRGRTDTLLKTWRESGRGMFDLHTGLITDLIALIATIGDRSNLSFDPHQASYYLADATRIAIPQLMEEMGLVRDRALTIAAQGGLVREEEIKSFSRNYAMVLYYNDRLKSDYEKAYAEAAAYKPRLEGKRQAVTDAADSFLGSLEREFLNVKTAKISPTDWWDLSTRATDAALELYDTTAPVLTELLQARLDRLSSQLYWTIGLLLLGFMAVALSGYAIVRDIDDSLGGVLQAAQKLAIGDLSVSLAAETRRDEVGTLATAFARMVRALRNVADAADRISRGDLAVEVKPLSPQDVMGSALARMTTNLQDQMRSLTDGIDHLTTANERIQKVVEDVASGASQAASAVNAASITVQEVRQTAEAAQARAAEVTESGARAVSISAGGEKAVQDAVDGMERVRDQLRLIAKKVSHLGEQSRAVAQITATVSDLADQSDLLSVNAGIEAVRAGIHGKGFAVVAQEVKNLSDRSKRATTQIANIIADIQKASSDVIQASEHGTRTAEAGIQQAIDSSSAMRSLAKSLGETAASVAGITSSSERQLVDVDQIAEAMERIRAASDANQESVNGIEESVLELVQVNMNLKDMVKRYKLAV